ncbi:MAG TPA: hypothetical protein VFX17_01575 [Patescibacteria group bacterium]|nr:hypothetical protein [Patescibacteria group bacterium]
MTEEERPVVHVGSYDEDVEPEPAKPTVLDYAELARHTTACLNKGRTERSKEVYFDNIKESLEKHKVLAPNRVVYTQRLAFALQSPLLNTLPLVSSGIEMDPYHRTATDEEIRNVAVCLVKNHYTLDELAQSIKVYANGQSVTPVVKVKQARRAWWKPQLPWITVLIFVGIVVLLVLYRPWRTTSTVVTNTTTKQAAAAPAKPAAAHAPSTTTVTTTTANQPATSPSGVTLDRVATDLGKLAYTVNAQRTQIKTNTDRIQGLKEDHIYPLEQRTAQLAARQDNLERTSRPRVRTTSRRKVVKVETVIDPVTGRKIVVYFRR